MGLVPLFPRNMLATHPAEEKRLESISRSNREHGASRKMICLTLLSVVILSGVLLTAFVDTRNILVQSSPTDMIMPGATGPRVIDQASVGNANQVRFEAILYNITYLPPPWLLNQTGLPAAHFLNSSE